MLLIRQLRKKVEKLSTPQELKEKEINKQNNNEIVVTLKCRTSQTVMQKYKLGKWKPSAGEVNRCAASPFQLQGTYPAEKLLDDFLPQKIFRFWISTT